MKIVLISGLSGSGKSVALRQMEDSGYFCVDNLPLEMLPALVSYHIERADETELAVSVDVRSGIDIGQAREQIAYLRGLGHRVEVLFVEAEESVLVRRFSETRRGHPLSNQDMTLLESLKKEREWLFPLKEIAYCIDTSKMNAQQLRHAVRQWLKVERTGLLVILESFGFKYGVPNNADFMFDMRSLPNPYYDPELRPYTGMDKPVGIIWTDSRLCRKWLTTSKGLLRIGYRVWRMKAGATLPSPSVAREDSTVRSILSKNSPEG